MSLYISQQKSELLDSLENQVRFSQLVAVLVGAKGLGKSFLLEQLGARLKDEVAIANVDAGMAMSDDQLDKTISLQLGLSWQDSNADLATRIANTHSEKVLITIDNAHLLSASCLEFVLKLNQSQLNDKNSMLFILLAGENNLPALINKTPTFTQHPEMCVVFEVEPIQQSETRAIVNTFSHPNSEVLRELKSGSKLDYFWQLAKGNPAELNYHMSRWLDEHSPTQVVEVESKTQPTTILKAVVYCVLAIVLSSMLVYQEEINQWIAPEPDKTSALKEETSKPEASLIEDSSQKNNDIESEPLNRSPAEISEVDKQAELSKDSNLDLQLEEQFDQELAEVDQPASEQRDSAINSVKSPQEQTNLLGQASSKKARKTKTVDSDKAPTLENKARKKITQAASNASEPTSTLTSDEQLLLTKSPQSFVLQWAGVSSLAAAEKYRNEHIAKEQMYVYRRANKQTTLFLIVSDDFSNRALAEFALNNYLQQGVKEKPWIKSLEAVHKEIKQFEQSSD